MSPKITDPDSFGDQPETDQAALRPKDLLPRDKFIAQIKGMLVDDEYEYAEGTLRGILKTVETTGMVTNLQRQAIENITAKPSRRGGPGDQDRRRRGRW